MMHDLRLGGRHIRKSFTPVLLASAVATLAFAMAAPEASAASAPGVSKTSISVGVPYVDLAAVDQQFGLHINQGSYPDAYDALFASINAHGGLNGRKEVG